MYHENSIVFLFTLSMLAVQSQLKAQDFERIDPLRHAKENIHFLNDANGKPFKSVRNFEEEGSPYFSDNYLPSTIQMLNGKTYHNIPVKFNQLTGEVIFKTSDGQEMLVVNPFKELNCSMKEKPTSSGVVSSLLINKLMHRYINYLTQERLFY